MGQAYASIRDTSRQLPRIDPSQVASALGAEATGVSFSPAGGPLSLFQIRQEILRRLGATGGSDGVRQAYVPLSAAQWEELEAIAAEVASPGFSPSASQVAAVLLSLSLRSVRRTKDEDRDASPAGSIK